MRKREFPRAMNSRFLIATARWPAYSFNIYPKSPLVFCDHLLQLIALDVWLSCVAWMIQLVDRRAARLLAAGALTLTAAVLLAPTRSHASCGDYVTVGSGSEHQSGPNSFSPWMPRTDDKPHSQPAPTTSPCPCRGELPSPYPRSPGPCPGCSDSVPPRPLTSRPATSPQERDWATAASTPIPPELHFHTLLQSTLSPRPDRQGADVYHPPR
jgi:hypothetical protein